MTFDELQYALDQILPSAELTEDAEGHLVILTNMHEDLNGELISINLA